MKQNSQSRLLWTFLEIDEKRTVYYCKQSTTDVPKSNPSSHNSEVDYTLVDNDGHAVRLHCGRAVLLLFYTR